jgi:hypothetical protein
LEFAPRGRLGHEIETEAVTTPVLVATAQSGEAPVFNVPFPFDVIFLVAAVAALILGIRRLAGGEPIDLGALFTSPAATLPWPRGVQEEEPRPWRVEILDRRGAARTGAPRRAAASAMARTDAGSVPG